MRFRVLPLLALLPLPPAAADDLEWHVQVSDASKFAPVEFTAQLGNVSPRKVPFRAEGERPLMDLILEAEGKEPVRKRLPKDAVVSKGPSVLEPSALAWYVRGDLRRAFGRLAPGKYALRVDLEGRVSGAAAFEVIDTSLEDAKTVAPEGIELRVEKGVAVLVNRRKAAVRLFAYGQREPLDALVFVQQWTGRGWTASPGGYCGTGLEEVTVPGGGGERRIALPPLPDGILRIAVSCLDGLEALSEPFLVDSFKG